MSRVLALATAAVVATLVTACGGSDRATADDAETARVLVQASAATQRAMQPLYGCLPENPGCYAAAGPPVVRAVDAARERLRATLEETDNECIKEAGQVFARSLDAYHAAGEAAVAGDPEAVDAATLESSDHEIAFLAKIDECGGDAGRGALLGAELRRINTEILRIDQELYACETEACVRSAGQRLADAADRGRAELARITVTLSEEEGASCFTRAFEHMAKGYDLLGDSMRALLEGRFRQAERLGSRSGTATVEAQEMLATCFQ